MKHVLRACATVLATTALAVTALGAAPASADEPVPSGCAGSYYYVCTGSAEPPFYDTAPDEYPIRFTLPGMPLVPGQTIPGWNIGGVVVPVGGQSTPGVSGSTGPTDPVATGVIVPVNVCAFVTCVPAGTPIDVPGIPLPVVPVNVPAFTVPAQQVTVPVVGSIPTAQTPGVGLPPFDQTVTTIRIYRVNSDMFALALAVCRAGGSDYYETYDFATGQWRYGCSGGSTKPVADAMFRQAGYPN